MLAGRVLLTLVAERALPAVSAYTLAGFGAVSVSLAAALQTDRFFAVFALPAGQTGQLPVAVAGVVAESVVPGRTLFGAAFSVVAFVADEPVSVSQLCLLSSLRVLRPIRAYAQLPLDGHKANHKVCIVGIYR